MSYIHLLVDNVFDDVMAVQSPVPIAKIMKCCIFYVF